MKISKKDSNTAVIKFYGAIGTWYQNAQDFTDVFEQLDREYGNIEIRVHSIGGSVFEGNVIYNALKNAKANVTIRIDGIAASMMSIVMLGAKKIIAADNSFIMIHSPSGYTDGTAKTHQETAKLLTAMEKNFVKAYAARSGKTEKEVAKLMDGEDHWFSAEEALAMGLIDEIADAVLPDVTVELPQDEAVTADEMYVRFAALLSPENSFQPISKTNTTSMKKLLITMFALAAAGITEASTDEQVAEAISNKFKDLEGKITDAQKASAQRMIAAHEQASGKPLDDKLKATLEDIGVKAGLEALSASLGLHAPTAAATQAPQGPRIVDMLSGKGGGAGDTRKDWTWNDYQEKDSKALVKMETENWDAFAALYKAEYGVNPEK